VQWCHCRCLRLFPAPFLRLDAGLDRRPVGDPVQPAAKGVGTPDRARLPGQDEERALKRVLNVVLTTEHGPASGQDHRPVTGHQGLEGNFILGTGIPGQQFAVRQPDGRPGTEEIAEMPECRPQNRTRHAMDSFGRVAPRSSPPTLKRGIAADSSRHSCRNVRRPPRARRPRSSFPGSRRAASFSAERSYLCLNHRRHRRHGRGASPGACRFTGPPSARTIGRGEVDPSATNRQSDRVPVAEGLPCPLRT